MVDVVFSDISGCRWVESFQILWLRRGKSGGADFVPARGSGRWSNFRREGWEW